MCFGCIDAKFKLIGHKHESQLSLAAVQVKKDILAWKAHQLRTVNQDQAKHDVLDVLRRSSALLVMDWAMKFLLRKFRESQCDWFAKRGIP